MMKQQLPKNWIVLNSKTHPDRVYYFNVKTNQSSWEEPTTAQTGKVTRRSTKRKKSPEKDEVSAVSPTSPKQNVPGKEIVTRKKLVAKRSSQQRQEEINKERETPQMKAIREKMLKRNRNSVSKTNPCKPSNELTKSTSPRVDGAPLTPKSDMIVDSKTTYTPQMRVLLEKMQERTTKNGSKLKEKRQDEGNNIRKEAEPIKTRLRNQDARNNKCPPEYSSDLLNKNKEKGGTTKEVDIEANATEGIRRRRTKQYISVPAKQSRTSLKKNLEKLPNMYKNAEVTLTRLKEKVLNNKNYNNKDSFTDAPEERTNTSQESVTTISDLVNCSNVDSSCEDMDWEPLEDEKITFEVQAVRIQLCTENSASTSCKIPAKTLKHPMLSENREKKQLYIVVDTNVFLSNIKAIELAQETIFKTYGRPFIVIPWTVIRELDYIKDNKCKTKPASLCVQARKAVSYINKLFSSKQPRIVGQTPEDVAKNKEKFLVDCPDDEILQTCLQILDLGKSVVLLSYDMNLCNKAMIYDIVTLGRNDPIEKVDYLNATDDINETFSNSNKVNGERYSLEPLLILNQEHRFADEVFEDIKSILRDFLTVIVSKEMEVLYGESWEKYVIMKPPWTAITVLQCAIKHWMAAVSESFRRKAVFILKDFLQIFKNVSGKRSLKENSYCLDKCSNLIQMVRVNKHPDLISRISKKIDELKEKCCNYESRVLEQKLRDAIGVEEDIDEQERRAQKAFHYFEAAYVFARDMCGLATKVAGVPCSFHYNIPNPLPSVNYVKQIQPELATNVNKLLCILTDVIEQFKNSSTDYRTVINLHQTLITFLPENTITEMILPDIIPLDIYCCITRKEEVLKRGLRQLQDLNTHFCKLASSGSM